MAKVLRWRMWARLVTKLCLTLCDPMDYSLPGPSVQARILEWVFISFSTRSSGPRDRTCIYVTSIVSQFSSVQFSSVAQSYTTLCNPMERSTPGLPVHHQLLESTQTHVHWVSDAIQPSHPLSSPSPPAFNLSQHQSLFKRVHQVAKVLEFYLHHQCFQWIFRTVFL